MEECTASSQVGAFIFAFLLVFLIHAAPMAYVFKRWGYRYCLGLLPAAFCALGVASYLSLKAPCGIVQSEGIAIFIAAGFYVICYLLIMFFKPDLKFSFIAWGEAIVPVFLTFPIYGAIFAVLWLLSSKGRDRLLMDTGKKVSLKHRTLETLAHGVFIILFGIYVAS